MKILLIYFMASVSAACAQPWLRIVTPDTGVDFVYRSGPSLLENPEVVGAGVALPDFDGDGLPDLYLVNGADVRPDFKFDRHPDRLYRNAGGLRFTDVTRAAGVHGEGIGQGVTAVDADNDGYTDLLLTGFREGLYWRNNGDGTFTERARAAGFKTCEFGMSSAFADYDRDGLLDVYVVGYVDFAYEIAPPPLVNEARGRPAIPSLGPNFRGLDNLLYRARGDGRYAGVTDDARVRDNPLFLSRSMGTLFVDLERDGWPDILVANDQAPLMYYRNRPNRSFQDATTRAYLNDNRGHMGLAVGDFDADGQLDLFVTNFDLEHNAFFRQVRPGRFAEISQKVETDRTDLFTVGWGTAFVDLDTDGWVDLVAANGHLLPKELKVGMQLPKRLEPWGQRMHVFKNDAGKKIQQISATAIDPANPEVQGRGLAVGDLDADGVPDLVVGVNNGAPLIMRNVAGRREHGAIVELVGTASNRAAVGALIEALPRTASGPPRSLKPILAGNGYLSSDAPAVHVTLGEGAGPTPARIFWPTGAYADVTLTPGRRHRFVER